MDRKQKYVFVRETNLWGGIVNTLKRQDLKVPDDLDKSESYATINTKKTDVMLHTKGRKMVHSAWHFKVGIQ